MAAPVYDAHYMLDGVDRRCRVVGERPSGSVIDTEVGRFHGHQFELEFEDGTTEWTITYPNYAKPVEAI